MVSSIVSSLWKAFPVSRSEDILIFFMALYSSFFTQHFILFEFLCEPGSKLNFFQRCPNFLKIIH